MVEELRVAEPQLVEQPIEPVETPPQPEEDIISKVSKFKPESVQVEEPQKESGKFNINDLDAEIDKIDDEALKTQMVALKKSLISGENKKYQEIAEMRKKYESLIEQSTNWTPERLQSELNKPDFVEAAQKIMGKSNVPDTYEEYSALSEKDKELLDSVRKEREAFQQERQQAFIQKQHADLSNKYANYNQEVMDQTLKKLQTGDVQITLEDVFRAVDYEEGIKRAYQMGLQDRQEQTQEKVDAASYGVGRNIAQPSTIEREQGESLQEFIHRSYGAHTKK